MLTKKQSELLRFIHERLQEAGVPPSFDEMKDALDLRSKSGIHRLIIALEERGFIRRLANRARAIEVLRLPESATVAAPRAQRFSPSVISGSLGRLRAPPSSRGGEAQHPVMVPVMGRIAAGTPISAILRQSAGSWPTPERFNARRRSKENSLPRKPVTASCSWRCSSLYSNSTRAFP